jgi:hypothetical protein
MSISTSGDGGPSLDLDKLAAAISGSIAWGWFVGFQEVFSRIISGLTSSLDSIGIWISDSFIPALFEVGLGPAAAAIQANISYLESLGFWGLPIGAMQLIVVGYLTIQIIQLSIEPVYGVISS